MMVIRFRSEEEHDKFVHKLKKMKKHIEEMIECAEENAYEDDEVYYRKQSNRPYRMRGRMRYDNPDYED